MSRTQSAALGVVVLIAALILVLVLRNPKAPFMPPDEDHDRFVNAQPCLVCHGPDGGMPRSMNHPIGTDCMRCHAHP